MAEKKDLSSKEGELMNRLKRFEGTELANNEVVQRILEKAKERCMTFDLEGEPIRIVTAFPREVRYFYEKQRSRPAGEKVNFSEIEADAYKVAAQFCLDAPFNTPDFWEYYDTMTGRFWGIFNSIYSGIEKNEEKIGDFRKK